MYVHMDQSVKTLVDEGLIEKTLKALAVRDKSNLKIGHENYPKTVRFF